MVFSEHSVENPRFVFCYDFAKVQLELLYKALWLPVYEESLKNYFYTM